MFHFKFVVSTADPSHHHLAPALASGCAAGQFCAKAVIGDKAIRPKSKDVRLVFFISIIIKVDDID
jgi:hypothetical protein